MDMPKHMAILLLAFSATLNCNEKERVRSAAYQLDSEAIIPMSKNTEFLGNKPSGKRFYQTKPGFIIGASYISRLMGTRKGGGETMCAPY